MDLSSAITSLPSTQMSELAQTMGQQLAVTDLTAAPSAAAAAAPVTLSGLEAAVAKPPVSVDLSPAAQALLDSQVGGLQIAQLEHAEGLATDPQATGAVDSTDPADPFGTGFSVDDGFTNADGTDDQHLAAALGEPDPSSTPTTAPNPASDDTTPIGEYSPYSDPATDGSY